MDEFCENLPKIELHAHLGGSLSEKTLKSLKCLDENVSDYQLINTCEQPCEKSLSECFELFKIAQNATSNPESIYLATKSVIQEFYEDNVIYLELRTTPRAEENMSKTQYIESVIRAIKDNTKNIIVKLILSIDRKHESKISHENLELYIEMRDRYPDEIVGVELSGSPYLGVFDESLFKIARENGFQIAIHCAEIPNENEVKQILNFAPNRLGHCTAIHPKYKGSDEIWRLFCEKRIVTECCLTSNVICGTVKDYKSHHLKELIEEGLPFTISTDDKGVFDTSLSKEFKIAAKHYSLNFNDLWEIAYKSIDYTFCSEPEKNILRNTLSQWRNKQSF